MQGIKTTAKVILAIFAISFGAQASYVTPVQSFLSGIMHKDFYSRIPAISPESSKNACLFLGILGVLGAGSVIYKKTKYT